MVKETRYREVVNQLKKLGWSLRSTKGSHEKWVSPSGEMLIIPKHSAISPGVMRQVIKKLGDRALTQWK
jgi:predicted RNA binding protein YcfA (HicA-like mRNA interferase family)